MDTEGDDLQPSVKDNMITIMTHILITSLIPRPLPFLRVTYNNEMWEWPGDEAMNYSTCNYVLCVYSVHITYSQSLTTFMSII